mmetsp:Transcript_8824/g.14659  ORF Transcript_8824/g.14659 Transcript_8824/m.14659 type:complete len:364 (+) Transcript_8824:299-1390(+)
MIRLGKIRIVLVLIATRFRIKGFAVHSIGGGASKQGFGLFIEKGYPRGGGIVSNGGGKDPSADAIGKSSLALVAKPIHVGCLRHLEAILAGFASIGTSRVPSTALLVLLEKRKSCLEGNPIGLVGIGTQLLFGNPRNRLTIDERIHFSTTTPHTGAERARLRRLSSTLPPLLQFLCLRQRRINDSSSTRREGSTLAIVIGQSHPSKGHNGLIGIQSGRLTGFFAPQCNGNGNAGIVHDGQIAFGQFLTTLFGHNRGGFADRLDHGQDIHDSIGLHGFQGGNFGKIVQLMRNFIIIVALVLQMNFRILIKSNFVIRFARIVLQIGHLETAATEGIDFVRFEHAIKLIDSFLEKGRLDIHATGIE